MNLTCKACRHDFSIDETNIDTEKVECPKCRWPNLVRQSRLNTGYFGRFSKTQILDHRPIKKWPRSKL